MDDSGKSTALLVYHTIVNPANLFLPLLLCSSSHHPLSSLLVPPRRRCALKVRGCLLSTACGRQQSTSGISTSTWRSPSRADCWSSTSRHRRWCRWVEQVISSVTTQQRSDQIRTPHKWFIYELVTDVCGKLCILAKLSFNKRFVLK